MPKLSHASLSLDMDPVQALDYWTASLESGDSVHAGNWLGGMVSINQVLRDFDGLVSTTTDIDFATVPSGGDWKFRLLGSLIWADITHNGTGLIVTLGTDNPTNVNIQGARSVVSGAETWWGDYQAHNSFNRALMVQKGETVQMGWSTDASTMSGALTMSIWGYLVPDITTSGS